MTDEEMMTACVAGVFEVGWAIGVFVLLLKIANRLARIIEIQEARP